MHLFLSLCPHQRGWGGGGGGGLVPVVPVGDHGNRG